MRFSAARLEFGNSAALDRADVGPSDRSHANSNQDRLCVVFRPEYRED
jgi:hypothetical protein